MSAFCPACIHLMQPHQTADGKRRCRTYGLELNELVEADCMRFVREPGSDDETPAWHWSTWHVGGDGRGD